MDNRSLTKKIRNDWESKETRFLELFDEVGLEWTAMGDGTRELLSRVSVTVWGVLIPEVHW